MVDNTGILPDSSRRSTGGRYFPEQFNRFACYSKASLLLLIASTTILSGCISPISGSKIKLRIAEPTRPIVVDNENNTAQAENTKRVATVTLPAQQDAPDKDVPLDKEDVSSLEILLPTEEEISSFETHADDGPQQAAATPEPTVQYDFPMAMNRKVEFFLDHFRHTQPKTFKKWLARSTRYLSIIQEELKKEDMPLDLAYLPMIESGYRLNAYSKARAAGPWQFIRSTGRMYDLRIDNYVDERRDPIKSTKAAVAFLKDLYNEFGNWQLAAAAYNAGAGRVRSAIRKKGSNDFWDLASSRYLKRETRYYVPKLIAAIMIAKEPERYGFENIEYEPPLEYETLDVPRWTTLQAVSVAGDIPFEDLRNLNRQLRRAITPPGTKLYPLKVPPTKKELVASNLPRVNAVVTTKYKTHVVKNGDTVTGVCNNYNINKKTLLKANNLRSAKLKQGQRLRIPYKTTKYTLFAENQMAGNLSPAEKAPENLVVHKVQSGETISELSRRYNVPMHMIAAWNGLNNLNSIRAGQTLSFYLQDALQTGSVRHAAVTESKKDLTTASSPSRHLTANVKAVHPRLKNQKTKLTYYQVKGGDSLWAIAEKFQTTPAKIRQWNSMESDLIYPGHRLLLRVVEDIDA